MDKKPGIKPLTIALGTAFAAGLASASIANAVPMHEGAQNPFAMKALSGGYMLTAMEEGKCGGNKKSAEEAKCGGSSKKATGEAKCGEAKCGGDKKATGDGDKKTVREAKCGEAKCGGAR